MTLVVNKSYSVPTSNSYRYCFRMISWAILSYTYSTTYWSGDLHRTTLSDAMAPIPTN